MCLANLRLALEHAIAIFHSRLECRKQNTHITSSMSEGEGEGEVGQIKGVRECRKLGGVSLFPIIIPLFPRGAEGR
jgi:hypothetical protein